MLYQFADDPSLGRRVLLTLVLTMLRGDRNMQASPANEWQRKHAMGEV